jgi:hypothetical protein
MVCAASVACWRVYLVAAGDYVRITDGRSVCRIQDPAAGSVEIPVLELSPVGGLLGRDASGAWHPDNGAYLDCTLVLSGVPPKQVFATVASSNERGVSVRWMHFDPGDESKVKGLIAAYSEAQQKPATPAATTTAHTGTRRVIRAGGTGGDARPAAETPAAEPPKAEGRVGTRRILRPGAAKPAEPERSGEIGDDSRSSPVVLAPTDRFVKMTDISAPAGVEVASSSVQEPALERRGGSESPDVPAKPAPQPESRPAPPSEGRPAPQASGTSGRTAVISKDGRMDIGASIRSRSKTVMASELAARHEKVRVLNMSTIKVLIQEAVNEAAAHLTKALGEGERKRLLEEAEEGFKERLKAFQLEKASAEEKSKALQEQLKAAQDLLEQERKRSIKAEQFTVSDAGLVEIDKRMAKALERAVSGGGVTPEVEAQLRGLVAHVLDSEREKIRVKELEAQNSKIELLEKKIKRLANSLEETEKQRDDYQSMLTEMEKSGGGLRGIMKAGIKGDDPSKAKKLELMKTILEENRALREKLGIKLNQVSEVLEKAAVDAGVMTEGEAKAAHEANAAEEAAAEPVPGAEVAPGGEAEAETAAGGPEVDPDDMPWEAQPLNFAGGENEHGVKKMGVANPLAFTPPPLERADGSEPVADDAPLTNPDDEVWEAQPLSFTGGENEHGVKKLAVANPLDFTPPPLEKK